MPLIELHTQIEAPIERCFLLSLSVDLHQASTGHTGERVVAGVLEGILKEGDSVTWRATHFGITQNLTSVVHTVRPPHYFVDEMTKGAFKKLHHQHIFSSHGTGTLMTDKFYFEAPLGILGRIACSLVLTSYMTRFLEIRNGAIKCIAESDEWRSFLTTR